MNTDWREIEPADLADHAGRFPAGAAQLALAAAAAGHSRARLWRAADAAVFWDQANNVLYLAGQPQPAAGRELRDVIRAEALARGRPWFNARGPAGVDPDLAAFGLADLGLTRRIKLLHTLPAGVTPAAPPAPAGVEFALIDGAFLAGRVCWRNLERVRAEVAQMWPGLADFAARGFGVAARRGDALLCWCTAEYVGPRTCGIGIETDEAEQGRGLATAAAARFLALSRARGLEPHWECDAQNGASARVAAKLGLEVRETAAAWAGRF